MKNASRTTQAMKARLYQARAVCLLMVAFLVYFALAKPAHASLNDASLELVNASIAQTLSHQDHSDDNSLAVDESLPLSCEDCDGRGLDDDSDADSYEFDMDEFVATLPHQNVLYYVPAYALEDMHMSLPPFVRGLEYPPDSVV